MNIVDVHTHFFPKEMNLNRSKFCKLDKNFNLLYSDEKINIPTENELLEIINKFPGIKLVVQSISYIDYELSKYTNDFLLELSENYDQIKVFGSINTNWGTDKCIEEINRINQLGATGIGELHPDIQGFDVLDFDAFDPIVENLISNNMLINFHSSEPVGHDYNGKGKMFPDILYKFALNYKELKIIYSHLGGGLPIYYLMPEIMRDLNNVYYDTAALDFLYDPKIVKIFHEIIGEDKILFGSDYGLIEIDRAINSILQLDIDSKAKENILCNNALKLLSW